MAGRPSDFIRRQLERRLAQAMTEYGKAYAQAIAAEAPRGLTRGSHAAGSLIKSVRYEPRTPTSGVISMEFYGEYVATATPRLSAEASAVRMRERYAARVGRSISHPNDFPARAWDSAAMRAARDRLPFEIVRGE